MFVNKRVNTMLFGFLYAEWASIARAEAGSGSMTTEERIMLWNGAKPSPERPIAVSKKVEVPVGPGWEREWEKLENLGLFFVLLQVNSFSTRFPTTESSPVRLGFCAAWESKSGQQKRSAGALMPSKRPQLFGPWPETPTESENT